MSASVRRPSEDIPESIDVVHSDERLGCANWGRFNLLVWRNDISALGVSVWARAMNQLKQSYPNQRFGQITWIEPECSFGRDPSAFAACVDALKRFQGTLAASASVYARDGFWGATMRGRVTAIHSESKTEVPYTLRATLAEAHGWLCEQAPDLPMITLVALTRALEQLRERR